MLEKYYPEEYHLLELLADGNLERFNQEASDPVMIAHLLDYGLAKQNGPSSYQITIPAVKRATCCQISNFLARRLLVEKQKSKCFKTKYYGTLDDLTNLTQNQGDIRNKSMPSLRTGRNGSLFLAIN